MIAFHQTMMGQRFIEGTVPDLVLQMKRIANTLERILDALEGERPPSSEARASEQNVPIEKKGS